MLRIAITDDHTLFRKTLALLIKDFKNMEVVLEAANGKELLEKLKNTPIDILLLDLQMPVMSGFETIPCVKKEYPHIKTIILSSLVDIEIIRELTKMGIRGYFTKNTPPRELEEALWNVKDNGFHFEKGLATVMEEIRANRNYDIENKNGIQFTERELEIIRLTALSTKLNDISEILNISPKTVSAHKQNIQNKYDFPDMVAVILYCMEKNLIKKE